MHLSQPGRLALCWPPAHCLRLVPLWMDSHRLHARPQQAPSGVRNEQTTFPLLSKHRRGSLYLQGVFGAHRSCMSVFQQSRCPQPVASQAVLLAPATDPSAPGSPRVSSNASHSTVSSPRAKLLLEPRKANPSLLRGTAFCHSILGPRSPIFQGVGRWWTPNLPAFWSASPRGDTSRAEEP